MFCIPMYLTFHIKKFQYFLEIGNLSHSFRFIFILPHKSIEMSETYLLPFSYNLLFIFSIQTDIKAKKVNKNKKLINTVIHSRFHFLVNCLNIKSYICLLFQNCKICLVSNIKVRYI